MRGEAIFAPVSALALWTVAVAVTTGFRRVQAVRARRVPPNAFKLGESSDVPPEVAVANRNLMNLLEMPLLFYVVVIALYVTHHANRGAVWLAWAYVAARVLHSFEHLTSNHIRRRLMLFVVGNVLLVVLWVRLLTALF